MSLFIAMSFYSLSMSITPGPVNLITFSSAVNFGFRPTMRFVAGASLGFTLMLYLIGLGLGQLVDLQGGDGIKFVTLLGCLLMAYMGVKIALSSSIDQPKEQSAPHFLSGFFLQWLNPKAWIASIAGISAFNLTDSHTTLLLFVSLYFTICFLCISGWAWAGTKVAQLLRHQRQLRYLNLILGALLCLVAVFLLLSQW